MASATNLNKNSSEKIKKSYVALIAEAILASPDVKLNLSQIYESLETRHPSFRNKSSGWKNSVRHNLSLNECFIKSGRCEDGKGHYWTIADQYSETFKTGNFKVKQKSRRKKNVPISTVNSQIGVHKYACKDPPEWFNQTIVGGMHSVPTTFCIPLQWADGIYREKLILYTQLLREQFIHTSAHL